ncbi:MAG: hypothetical protein R3D25_03150 [Geminicoccaceae bacterium]
MVALRLATTSCVIALGLATTAAAAEPLRLTTMQLDAVTAGALSGVDFFVAATAGSDSTALNIFPTFSSGTPGTNSGTANGNVSLSDNGDSVDGEFEVRFYNRTTPFSSVTLGLITSEAETTGAGTFNAGANAIAEGDFAIPFAVTLPVIPGGNKNFTVTLGVAADNPLSPFNGGGGGI